MSRLILIFFLLLVIMPVIEEETTAQPQMDLISFLNSTRKLYNDKKKLKAIDQFEKITDVPSLLKTGDLKKQEEFLWEKAMYNLEYSNELTNSKQYVPFAKRAKKYWKDYIDWYNRLTDQDKNLLNPDNDRIKMATAHLGNAVIRTGEPENLFGEYLHIPDTKYFGENAIDLWKSWLYYFPEKRTVPSSDRTSEVRRRKICSENFTEEWLNYAERLEDWATFERINSTERRARLREVIQIRQAADQCNN